MHANSVEISKVSRAKALAKPKLASLQCGPWRVAVLEPVGSDALLLRWLSERQLPPMLLARHVVLRDPADVAPLTVDSRQTELRPLGSAFDALLAKVQQSLAHERSFVQDAAHQLRTPLAVIAAQAHVLVHASEGKDQQAREAQAALERAVERASHVVHQLLTLARLESGATPLARAVELVELTRQMLIAAAALAAAKDIEISLDSPEELWGEVDRESFHSILDKLLRNALAYCPGRGAR